ncbi:MAG: hypothetical protein LUQ08_03945, partial [Methanothrix sp.]|nr:hypothetical protein [Methanothrix sp.]
ASFRLDPSDLAKRRQMIIAVAKDAYGLSGQGSVQIKCDARNVGGSNPAETGKKAAACIFQ